MQTIPGAADDSTFGSAAHPFDHTPVLSRELVDGLAIQPQGHYLDLTIGGGGHSRLILAVAPQVQVTAVDQDAQALAAARQRLQPYGDRVHFWHGNFAEFEPGETCFDGILADLGVSSAQFDQPERGFSFRHEAPLDMRMDQRQPLRAADIVNQTAEQELADIFYHYGEERFSRRIARKIIAQRPLATTTELAAIVAQAIPRRPSGSRRGIHPATRVFQALRIAVNRELAVLETLLTQVPTWLKPGGRVGIISFHSLEDRRVKHALREAPGLCVLTKKPITAQPDEIRQNPRSRSAKLRLAQRQESSEIL